jgi:hypothetical protein
MKDLNLTKVIFNGAIQGYYKITPNQVRIYDSNMIECTGFKEGNITCGNDAMLFLAYKNGDLRFRNYVTNNLLK